MSDITGSTPIPKAVQSVSHGTDKATGVARDKQQTNTQTQEGDRREQQKPEQQETVNSRDPAVSISASAAHLHVGEELKQKVTTVDPEGRPIIETETATFALRPDAGLKAGDDVTLVVKDAGKQLAADLLIRNNVPIDPPIRLNLVVIALHSIEPTPQNIASEKPEVTPNYKPVNRFSASRIVPPEANDAATLARVLGRGAEPSLTAPVKGAKTNPASDVAKKQPDLSALLSAQQTSTAKTPQGNLKAGDKPIIPPLLSGQEAVTSNRLMPQSALTAITTPNTAQSGATNGLGVVIPAMTTSGQTVNIQLLDPSISKVSPTEVASVIAIRALTPQDAKALPVAATALGNASALAHVETNKGAFVINQNAANSLVGELIRVSPSQQISATAPENTALPTYSAKLQGPTAPTAQNVQVQLPTSSTPANPYQNNTTITAVHITRAFLTPDGPKSDIRLETPLGDLSLTVPNNVRPAAGTTIILSPLPQAIDPVASQMTSAVASAIPPVSISQWPTFEQAYDILQTMAPASVQAMQSMAARTAQGGPKIANSAMFLLSALGSGNASNWLGKTAENALSERNPQLLDLLKEDISRLFNIASDTSGEWRALLLPFDAKNQDMPMLALLFGHGSSVDPDQQRKGQQNNDTEDEEINRFILEVQFSVLGPVQLDGSIKGNRFDLIVRSEKQFSPTLTQDTSELFSQALAAGAFTGSLGFSVEETFPVDVAAVLEQMSPDQQQQLA